MHGPISRSVVLRLPPGRAGKLHPNFEMIRRPMRGASFAVPLLAVTMAAACSERLPAGPQAGVEPRLSPDFFSAAVGYFASRTAVPVRVDPRPLRPEARLSWVRQDDLLEGQMEVIRMRTRVVESAGWRMADATEDWVCVLSQGPAPPVPRQEPDSIRQWRARCAESGDYQSFVFGLPQSGTDPDHPEWWRIRTMQMLPYGYQVVDLFLERRPNGTWIVVDARVRDGIFT